MNPLANSHRPGVVPRSRLLPLVSIGLLGVLAYTVGTHWPVRPVYDAAAPADCDLARGPCTAVFPDGASIRLAFDADRLTPLHPLPASVTVDGTDADAAHIEFSGIDMNMGLVTQELDRIGDGEFAGQVTLPVCVRGSMKWRAYVTAAAGAHYRALFVFETRR
ncbi:MAG: hypothetical protein KDI88_04685 [Gammaproteobacteria bacterium]|nr:hypothetical protein [Gammaproteobacteria bacterium]